MDPTTHLHSSPPVVGPSGRPSPTETNLDPLLTSQLGSLGSSEEGTEYTASQSKQAGRYELLERHAQGGLGDVYRAEDQELHRQVALKRLRPERGRTDQNQARFLQEAELTAELEHPGVVPVHGLVHDEDGQPCYAMRFVEGQTFAEAIRKFHEHLKADKEPARLFRGVEFRQLLQRFIAVCNTIAFAHSRAILHRDLKPANVLVGPFGETLLVDWGLAKRLGGDLQIDSESGANLLADLPTTRISIGNSTPQLTQAGQILGTPAYMSPEQVDGTRLSFSTDVYGLGAILYELLTGQPPVLPGELRATLTLVREGKLTPPRGVQPAVPAGIEAICLKALARDAAHRYATALELAADVENWLADEPVAALPDSRGVKLRRWARRHRTLVTAGGATLLLAVIGLTATTLLLGSKNRDLEAAAERERLAATRAQAEAARAERNFGLADNAISRVLNQFNNEKLKAIPNLEPVRIEMHEEALALQEKLLTDAAVTPSQKRERATALGRSGAMLVSLGKHADALTRYQEAIRILEGLVKEDPNDLWSQYQLAYEYGHLGQRWLATGHLDEAQAALLTSRTLLEAQRAASSHPKAEDVAEEQANILLILGELRYKQGQRREALALIIEGTKFFADELARPDLPPHRRLPVRRRYATIERNTGLAYKALGEPTAARKHFQAAIDLNRTVVREQPQSALAHDELAQALTDLGTLDNQEGDGEASLKLLQEAEQQQREALRLFPSNMDYEYGLSMILTNRQYTWARLNRPKEAQADSAAALAILRRLASLSPDTLAYRSDLFKALGARASRATDQSPPAEARALHEEVVSYGRTLVREKPGTPALIATLAGCINNFGFFVLEKEEDADSALALFNEAIALLDPLHTKEQPWRLAQLYLQNCYLGRAQCYEQKKQHKEAAADWRRADDQVPQSGRRTLCRLGEARNLIDAREPEAALNVLDDYPVPEKERGGTLFEFAQQYARLASLIAGDRKAQIQDQAIKLLLRAEAAGAFKKDSGREALRHESLAGMKDHPEFQKLVLRVNAKTKP